MPNNVRSKLLGLFLIVSGALLGVSQADILLHWKPNPTNDGVTDYMVYKSTDDGWNIDSKWHVGTDTFSVDSAIVEDTEYTYWITAWNARGESGKSNYVYGYQSNSDMSPWTGAAGVELQLVDSGSVRINWAVEASDRSVLQMRCTEGDTFITLTDLPGPGPWDLELPIAQVQNQSEVQVRIVAWLGPRMTIYAPQTLQIPEVPEAPEVEIRPFR